MRNWAIRIGALLLVSVGVAAFATGAPTASTPEVKDVAVPSTSQTSETDVSAILAEASANETGADSAPQQQVVNGWAAKDLLAGIARDQQAANAAQGAANAAQGAANEQWKAFAEGQVATAEQARKTGLLLSTLLVVLIVLTGFSIFARSISASVPAAGAAPIAPAPDPAPLSEPTVPGSRGQDSTPDGGAASDVPPDGQPDDS